MARMLSPRHTAALAALAALVPAPAVASAARGPAPATTAPSAPASCANADRTTANATVSQLASGVRCLIAQQRAGAGRPAVAPNARLAVAARGHAADMAARRYFAHTSLGGATLVNRLRRSGYIPKAGRWRVGEILAWATGEQATPRGIVNAWMASPEHRRVLLDPRLTEVGVGLVFGSPQASDPAAITVDADFGHVS
jgi:uncharacterized protein YkwD